MSKVIFFEKVKPDDKVRIQFQCETCKVWHEASVRKCTYCGGDIPINIWGPLGRFLVKSGKVDLKLD